MIYTGIINSTIKLPNYYKFPLSVKLRTSQSYQEFSITNDYEYYLPITNSGIIKIPIQIPADIRNSIELHIS